ncbi:hypothetical protein [Marinifilum caeruleilacunae]|uniref:PH domain-containing protein n=1 Tax=Marinifilum caeruleilacunae TaxID=2499076 RepID=A0ABX1WRI2_9BACT|nr:hypothetical protein [Marinifilum caeruleilacunae]NOU58682.1 hypothetical protein [Marinifilum caeruleilacunae]
MRQNVEIIYKSQFSPIVFIALIIGIGGFGFVGFMLLENYKEIGGAILLLPALFFILSSFCLTALLTLKTVVFTPQKLMVNYIFLPLKYKFDWNEISDVKMKFAAMRAGDNYKVVYKGSDLKIYFGKKSFVLESVGYLRFEELLSTFEKKITPGLRKKMKSTYKRSKKKFWEEDDKYWTIQHKIVLPISLGILILILLCR